VCLINWPDKILWARGNRKLTFGFSKWNWPIRW